MRAFWDVDLGLGGLIYMRMLSVNTLKLRHDPITKNISFGFLPNIKLNVSIIPHQRETCPVFQYFLPFFYV